MASDKQHKESRCCLLPSTYMLIHHRDQKFITFLRNELALSTADIAVVLRQRKFDKAPLPMLLWQYGLVDLDQLEKIFDWLEEQEFT